MIAINPDKYEKLNESKKDVFNSIAAKFCIEIKFRDEIDKNLNQSKSLKEEDENNPTLKRNKQINDTASNLINNDDSVAILREGPSNVEDTSRRLTSNINNLNLNVEISDNIKKSSMINPNTNNIKLDLSIIKEEKEIFTNSYKNTLSLDKKTLSSEIQLNKKIVKNFINNQENEKNISNKLINSDDNQIKSCSTSIKYDSKDEQIMQKNICNEESHIMNEYLENYKDEKLIENKLIKKLSIVDSKNPDENDEKLDDFLISTYNKNKMSYIPMKKISENIYEFGTQKIEIKIDDNVIRSNYFY